VSFVPLSAADLALASGLVLLLALASFLRDLGLERQILVAALRTVVQLTLVGFVLRSLFDAGTWTLVLLAATVMLLAAAREVLGRQRRPLAGGWGYSVGALSMFLSSFSVTAFALVAVIGATPWYQPQYAIPLLGMLLGNTMNGVALGLGRVTEGAHRDRAVIEQRLLLGHSRERATLELRRDAARTGMIPILNSMAAAGLVSLPGMMTGQILAGSPPVEAVKYQILILFLISGGTGAGVLFAVWAATRRLFDERQRLRLERLAS
jgi:putative ABC transport system permease protein